MKNHLHIAVIGGGAAGFFAAITCASAYPQHQVSLFEKSGKLLSKVSISGGGRCNVTHACFDNKKLSAFYPRGQKELLSVFSQFSVPDTMRWFSLRGVELKEEADGRMFPITDDSQTIIDCLMQEATSKGVSIHARTSIDGLKPVGQKWQLLSGGNALEFDRVIVATGGSPKLSGLGWLADLGHGIIEPVPSLFTFNLPDNPIRNLMGVSHQALVRLPGAKLEYEGPLLITHWGLSGPAVLKLSSFGARWLAEQGYRYDVQINWLPGTHEEAIRTTLLQLKENNSKKQLGNSNVFGLPSRLWEFLVVKAGCDPTRLVTDLPIKWINKLANTLSQDVYKADGKTTFKEEFVTCGGVSLADVDFRHMESKRCKGLFFAGEVLDIDGITGGFNFQAAWSTGYVAGMHAGKE